MAEEIDLFKTPTEPSFFIGQVQSRLKKQTLIGMSRKLP